MMSGGNPVIPPIASFSEGSEENIAMAVEEEAGRAVTAAEILQAKEKNDRANVGSDPFTFLEFVNSYPNTNEFVYLVSVSQGQSTYNPYNLRIVDYFSIDTKNPDGYYTMSAQVRFAMIAVFSITNVQCFNKTPTYPGCDPFKRQWTRNLYSY